MSHASRLRWSDELQRRLFAPVDVGFLIWLRVLLGALLLYEVWLFFRHGLISRYFIEPKFHFTYLGFGWVQPWPADGMYVHFALLGVLAGLILLGWYYRLAMPLFALGFAYVFLLEKARYMNHFYLVILLCGLMSLMPAGCRWSIDAWRRPDIRRRSVPAWMLWLLRFQVCVVYFFAGLAKLHPDWLSGRVLGEMFAYKTHLPLVAALADKPSAILLLSYAALLFDLGIAPALLWRRTRAAALAAMILFHLCNVVLFQIDIFPWLMIGLTLVLFLPERFALANMDRRTDAGELPTDTTGSANPRRTALWLGVYVILQIMIPLRHLAYPGDAAWTDEGQTFAWRMLMRVKSGRTPRFLARYTLESVPYQNEIPVPQDEEFWRLHWQFRKMLLDPDLVLQFVHLQADEIRAQGGENVQIRVLVPVSLNGREPKLLIDPAINLASQSRSLWPKDWITHPDATGSGAVPR